VAVLEALAIVLALLALALLPCLVVFVVFADAFLGSVHRQRRRLTRARLAAVSLAAPAIESAESEDVTPSGPPLEQIAAEIHRLSYARRTCASGSARFIAATKAYDRRLVYACRALEIEQHLAEVDGIDLDLERIRVEGLLLDAGFVLDNDASRPA
jgi:hypothetical protein